MMHRPCPETQTSAGDLRNQNTTTVLPVVYLPASMTSTWVQSKKKKKKKKKSKFPPLPPQKKKTSSKAACPQLSPRTLCSLTGEATSWAPTRRVTKRGQTSRCGSASLLRSHSSQTGSIIWVQWRGLCVCVCVCAKQHVDVKGCWPPGGSPLFLCYFHAAASLFLFSSSSPDIVADQWGWNKCVIWAHPHFFHSSSSLLIHAFVRKTLALFPHLICLSFPFRRLVWT